MNSMTKIWKTMQQCLEEEPWCQHIEGVDNYWPVTWAAAESLMKLAPVNGINVCELVFVHEMDAVCT